MAEVQEVPAEEGCSAEVAEAGAGLGLGDVRLCRSEHDGLGMQGLRDHGLFFA